MMRRSRRNCMCLKTHLPFFLFSILKLSSLDKPVSSSFLMKNRSATSIRNGRISIFLFHSNAFYGRSSSCKFLALSFITVFLFSGQFLLFFTEFLIIKLLTTIGHWVTQLNPHKLTCSCSAENLMYNYKKRDQLAQAFSWIRPPKNTKATKQRQHQKSSSFTVEF